MRHFLAHLKALFMIAEDIIHTFTQPATSTHQPAWIRNTTEAHMTSRHEAEIISLLSVAKAHQKKYCWVSQKRILTLLNAYHQITISNRTLNRDLRWLEDNAYITRLRRIRIDPQGRLVFNSTLYKFTGKLFNWLYSIGSRVNRLFSFFRMPKWADHQLSQKAASFTTLPGTVEKVLIKERDGTLFEYHPGTGAYQKCS